MIHAIGIDFGGTTIKSGLVAEGRIVQSGAIIETQNYGSPGDIVEALLQVVEKLRAPAPVTAIGIGLPGLIDSVNGIVHELTNVPGWRDVGLRDLLQGRTGLPVAIENDANAMAYGEWKYGAARDARHVVCITLGTGVGGALILDGRLYRGAQLGAGEIGHMSIDLHGRPGPYGNLGGLEEYVGNQQIAERAFELYQQAGAARDLAECTPAQLAAAAQGGDAIAAQLWETIGDELGTALASVVWLLNPETIVIGGGVAKAGAVLFEPIRRSISARTSRVFHEYLSIVPALLGNDAGIIGSAALALAESPSAAPLL
jgi:glucokinase